MTEQILLNEIPLTETIRFADKLIMTNQNQIAQLYKNYLVLMKLEARTEHLLPRLGELYCALHVNGQLCPEQDVLSARGRRIAVRTIIPGSGFVSFTEKTLSMADDLMVLEYRQGTLHIVYYDQISPLLHLCRPWQNSLELDLSKIGLAQVA